MSISSLRRTIEFVIEQQHDTPRMILAVVLVVIVVLFSFTAPGPQQCLAGHPTSLIGHSSQCRCSGSAPTS